MHGRSIVMALWRRRWAALLILVLELGVVACWLALSPRSYTATARISAAPQQDLLRSPGSVAELETTIAHLANSRAVLLDVRDRVGDKRTAGQLRDEVRGRRITGTVLIRITVEDTDRVFARNVANAVADVLPRHDPSGGMFLFTDAGRAATPTTFSSPDITRDALIGVGMGIVLALLVAFLRELAAGRVDAADQLAAITAAPVLGSVVGPTEATVPLWAADVAAFRALRVALEFASSDDPTHTVVVTPVASDATASWVTINLAGALAQVAHRVLVIDADFGTGPRHRALRSKGAGLAEVLRGERELRDVVRPSEVSGVSVVTAGDLAGEVAADLIELQFHRILGEVKDEIDIVLVHAAPVTESADAQVMAVGNAVLLTLAAGRVKPRTLREVVAELRRVRVIGAVLVGARTGR